MISNSHSTFLIILQLYITGTVNGQREHVTEGCKDEWLSLSCLSGSTINVTKVELGETRCYRWQQCCPSADDCTRPASQRHTRNVYSQCNGRKNCRVQAVMETIDCNGNSESERIKYYCVQLPTKPTAIPSSSSPSFSFSSAVWSVTTADNQTASSFGNGIVPVYTTDGYDGNNDVKDAEAAETKSDASQSIDEYRAKSFSDKANVVIVVSIVLLTLIVVSIVASVICLIRRRNRLMKAESNNGNLPLGFRQLEVSERHRDAAEASDEPVYELEMMVAGDRESREPLFTENIYSDLNGEQVTACSASDTPYDKPRDWNKAHGDGMKQQMEVPCSDLMVDDVTGNVYDEVLFRNQPDDPAEHIYGNIDSNDMRRAQNVYRDETPWNETANDADGMNPLHPESEYMIPHVLDTAVGTKSVTSSTPCDDPVYYAMDRCASEPSV